MHLAFTLALTVNSMCGGAPPAVEAAWRLAPARTTATMAVASGWQRCAARPVPLPPARAAGAAAIAAVQEAMNTWQAERRARIPSVSVSVRWDDGREILAATGFANRAQKVHVSVTTPFSLASVSKTFTAAVALLLDQCGVMPLTTTAKSLVPAAAIDPTATIEDLLRHRSGLGDWLNDKPWRFDWLVKHPTMSFSPLTVVTNVAHTVRGEYNYSNSGFTLITLAAEKATGRPWQELVRTLVLQPLGLTQTGYGPIPAAARSHWGVGKKLLPQGSPGWGPTRSVARALRGAGDLFSTPRDLARFGELFWGSRLIESGGSLALNGAAQPTGSGLLYTLGTQVRRDWGGPIRVYGHTGGFSGTTTAVERVPALGITIAAVSNGSPNAYESYAVSLARAVLGALDRPAADPYGAARPTAVSTGDPEPPDPPLANPTDQCGDPVADSSSTDTSTARWVSLGVTSGWSGSVTALAELPDGRIIAGGSALSRAAGVGVAGLAAWSPQTGSWSPFASVRTSTGGIGSVTALAVDATRGLLYIGGTFARVGNARGGASVSAVGLAQLNLATGVWSALGKGLAGAMRGGDATVTVHALALDATSGTLVVGGSFARAGGATSAGAARWTPTSKGVGTWRALGAGAGGVVDAIAIDAAGVISVAGYLSDGVVRAWSPTTGAWETIGSASTFADAPRLLLGSTAGLIAGRGVGWYGSALQVHDRGTSSGWSSFAGDVTYPRKTAWVSAGVELADGRIAIAGTFAMAGGAAANNVAIWDPAGGVETLGNGLAIEADALAASTHAELIAALRTRGVLPGSAGGQCITAWAPPAPATPLAPNAIATAARGTLAVHWSPALASSLPSGFIATATAKGRPTRSCSAPVSSSSCTIVGLTSRVAYRVSIVAWSDPAGPSPAAIVASARPH